MSRRQKIQAGHTVDWASFPVIPLSLVATEVVKWLVKGTGADLVVRSLVERVGPARAVVTRCDIDRAASGCAGRNFAAASTMLHFPAQGWEMRNRNFAAVQAIHHFPAQGWEMGNRNFAAVQAIHHFPARGWEIRNRNFAESLVHLVCYEFI